MLKSVLLILSCLALINCEEFVRKDGWFRKCPKVDPVSQLDLKAMSGDWFVVARSNDRVLSFCDRLKVEFLNENTVKLNISFVDENLKPFSMEAVDHYDPKFPGHLVAASHKNPILNLWYGAYDLQVLDGDYSKYALLYSCHYSVFGLRTEETAYLLARSLDTVIDAPTQYRLFNLVKSFDYGGGDFTKVSHNPKVCQ